MSGYGADEDEMGYFPRLGDRELDSVLAGNAPAGRDDLRELAAFFRDTRTLFAEAPEAATAAKHLAEIVSAARLVADDGERPIADRPARQRSRNPFSSLGTRVAAAAAGLALLAAFGGAAYAGVLPGPVQGTVADLAGTVGISLPGNENDVDQGDVGNADEGAQSTPDEPAQGNQNQRTRDDRDQPTQSDRDEGAVDNRHEGAENDRGEPPQDNSHEDARSNGDEAAQNDHAEQGTQSGGIQAGEGEKGAGGGPSGESDQRDGADEGNENG